VITQNEHFGGSGNSAKRDYYAEVNTESAIWICSVCVCVFGSSTWPNGLNCQSSARKCTCTVHTSENAWRL